MRKLRGWQFGIRHLGYLTCIVLVILCVWPWWITNIVVHVFLCGWTSAAFLQIVLGRIVAQYDDTATSLGSKRTWDVHLASMISLLIATITWIYICGPGYLARIAPTFLDLGELLLAMCMTVLVPIVMALWVIGMCLLVGGCLRQMFQGGSRTRVQYAAIVFVNLLMPLFGTFLRVGVVPRLF